MTIKAVGVKFPFCKHVVKAATEMQLLATQTSSPCLKTLSVDLGPLPHATYSCGGVFISQISNLQVQLHTKKGKFNTTSRGILDFLHYISELIVQRGEKKRKSEAFICSITHTDVWLNTLQFGNYKTSNSILQSFIPKHLFSCQLVTPLPISNSQLESTKKFKFINFHCKIHIHTPGRTWWEKDFLARRPAQGS